MNRFRIIFLVMAVLTFLVILAPLILGLVSAIFTYHWKCYGFTDGSWACSWQEYTSDKVFWAALLDIPLSMYLIPCWLVALGFWLYKRHTIALDGLSPSLVIIAGVSAVFVSFPFFQFSSDSSTGSIHYYGWRVVENRRIPSSSSLFQWHASNKECS